MPASHRRGGPACMALNKSKRTEKLDKRGTLREGTKPRNNQPAVRGRPTLTKPTPVPVRLDGKGNAQPGNCDKDIQRESTPALEWPKEGEEGEQMEVETLPTPLTEKNSPRVIKDAEESLIDSKVHPSSQNSID